MRKLIDRREAGELLAEQLKRYKNQPDVIVLALPRGGVPVGYEIAKALSVPLDVFVVRKLGVPGHEELAMGAVARGDEVIFNDEVMNMLHISESAVEQVIEVEREELERRERTYRGAHPFPSLANKTIILVDDGVATGATMGAAIQSLKKQKPAKIIIAIPVGEALVCQRIASVVDRMVCLFNPEYFSSVGEWYQDFPQTTDAEVARLLLEANETNIS